MNALGVSVITSFLRKKALANDGAKAPSPAVVVLY